MTITTSARTVSRGGCIALLAVAACVAISLAPGCNIVGGAALIIQGPPKIDAQFTLPPERPTVVFVDDRRSYLPRRNLRETIASTCGQRLLDKGAVKNVIESRAAILAAMGERNGEPLDMVTLTKNSKAEIMVWVTIDAFSLSPDQATFQPTSTIRVKVIDALAAEPRLWPAEREGKSLLVQLPIPAGSTPKTAAELSQSETALAERIGATVAELFYEHDRARLSDNSK